MPFPSFTTSPTDDPSSSPGDTPDELAVPDEPGESTVEDESDRGTDDDMAGETTGGGGQGEDERVIEIGGPTLENTYPTNPFVLENVNIPTCTLFTNTESNVPVTVRSVSLVNQTPPNAPGLALGAKPATNGYCSPQGPDYPSSIRKTFASCTNAKLEPAARTACPVEVRATGKDGIDYTATLVLRLSAVCTRVSGQPCARLPGRAHPTASDPITVMWTVTRHYTGCFAPRERDGISEEEMAGRCPPLERVGDPAPNGEPGTNQDPGSGNDPGNTRTAPTPSSDNG